MRKRVLAWLAVAPVLLAGDIQSARQLVQQGKIVEALRALDAALRAAPNDPEVQYQAGELLRELGAGRAARLAQLAPDSSEAHELSGESLESRGQLEDALQEYRAALRSQAGLPGIHFHLGNVLWKQRDFEAARAELERELAANPNHALANLRLGQALLSLNEPQSAVTHLLRAVAADNSSITAHRALGQAYRALGRHREALDQFLLVAKRRPQDDSVHAQLAGEYRALGNTARAKAEMEIHRGLLQAREQAARRH